MLMNVVSPGQELKLGKSKNDKDYFHSRQEAV